MGARPTPEAGSTEGNFVAEWFGHRVWPTVDTSNGAKTNQSARACPFITTATGEPTKCVKTTRGWTEPYGVCTIDSDSNGPRQDWIACPYRTLDQHFTLLANAVRSSYRVSDDVPVILLPLTILHRADQRQKIIDGLANGRRVYLFSSNKLGGEIELPESDASPGAAVDVSVIEVTSIDRDGKPTTFGKHLFYEIQTADFHGSPLHAAAMLKELCPAGDPSPTFHDQLLKVVEVSGTGIEGPNKANVFKRTVYQMIFKIELARRDPECAGFAIVLPVPVWDSWVKHLGQPTLEQVGDDEGHVAMLAPGENLADVAENAPAAIYVFEIDRDSHESPAPLKIMRRVWCSAVALSHYAFTVASEKAIENEVVADFRTSFIEKVAKGWDDELRPKERPKRARRATTRPDGEEAPEAPTPTITGSGQVNSEGANE